MFVHYIISHCGEGTTFQNFYFFLNRNFAFIDFFQRQIVFPSPRYFTRDFFVHVIPGRNLLAQVCCLCYDPNFLALYYISLSSFEFERSTIFSTFISEPPSLLFPTNSSGITCSSSLLVKNPRLFIHSPFIFIPFSSHPRFRNTSSSEQLKRFGASGSPCSTPFSTLNSVLILSNFTYPLAFLYISFIILIIFELMPMGF